MLLVTVRVLQGFSTGFRRQGAFLEIAPLVGVGDTKGDGPYRGGEGFPQWGVGGSPWLKIWSSPTPIKRLAPEVSQ